jgi:membrane protease YdiL (CAAX protease family)
VSVLALPPIAYQWNPGRWNWIGQSASLLFTLGFSAFFITRKEVGLRLPKSRSEILCTLGCIVVALAIAIGPALTGDDSHPDAETFAYQATLPGPVEERAFRGVALAPLLRTYGAVSRPRAAAVAAALITALWFASGHVIHLMDDGIIKLTWERMLDVFPMTLLYAAVRLRSNSLLGGILAHNGANTLVETVAAIRF